MLFRGAKIRNLFLFGKNILLVGSGQWVVANSIFFQRLVL